MSDPAASLAALGPIMQLSYCPRDYDAALRYWIGMGAGPFFELHHVQLENIRFRGEPSDIDFSMALGYLGDIQIELIRQHNDAPSMYTEWLAAGREGVQHMCVLVDDIAEARRRVVAIGGTVLQEGELPGGAGAVIYVDTGGGPGTVMEYLQIGQAGRDGFAMMREAHRNWDGTDPIRGRN
ncbi:VOC family protein [Sphingomonas oryzagri]|uniref:VOC family protein n=1 Tax=Sphingomonas oryzagri TaxID=3042314 RepID=A0ABT6MZA3_9SPHN|nr:VOC family protein [Sphingomonas oryzagri]MDH7637431.1 VOC family protein [Sphingomonas oryzagri]